MTSFVKAIALLLGLTAAASAQQVGEMVQSDLNGDGRVERFALIDTGEGAADLQIENTGGGVIYAENIVWVGGIGQEPELSVAENGSVLMTSMNASIGRNRWDLTLTIAYRKGVYRIAGYTYSWYDTLNPENWGTCDLNLLNGRGFLKTESGTKAIRTNVPARPATEWNLDVPFPEACEMG